MSVNDDPFDLCRRFGVKVVPVPVVLARPVTYIREDATAFISAGLTDEDVTAAADWLLSAALQPTSAPRR
ncbi:hypothetical protein N866_13510 [Actinotalea ferrariae CF5-4]|uniref:Uncharacterized protein n=1 Tax=Actinotalea ferrariae CF5-4 TaxID=948458 RepID=A0A021VSY4_9CELL|nr:hypothetical protein [Actinotalea ferrariae]EYR64266.1 hypothetical protein N866_13510 [Actinotalea ferrariae CF5-4]